MTSWFTTADEVLSALCRLSKKNGMYWSVSNCEDNPEEVQKAAPYLDLVDIINGYGYILFDTESEMCYFYSQTVGDEGPTKINNYNGPAKVYTMTCGPDGKLLTENT